MTGPKKFAVCIGYLPMLEFSGFSKQLHDSKNIFTLVTEALEKARLFNFSSKTKISYASRTDRGVGALHQVVAFSSNNTPILPEINSYLPDSIQTLGWTEVSSNFHPRRDAMLRTYSYFLTTTEDFDLVIARKTLETLKGMHDFSNFSKKDPRKEKSCIKEIKIAEIFPVFENTYHIRIASKSFLWQQVRRILGHLIEIASGFQNPQYTEYLLMSNSVKNKPPPVPAQYLILEAINYNDLSFQFDQKSVHSFQQTLKDHLINLKTTNALYSFFLQHLAMKKQFDEYF